MKRFTLKELIVNPKSESNAEAMGISPHRAEILIKMLEGVWKSTEHVRGWSVADIYTKSAELGIVKTPQEVAFVSYLIGCRVGEDSTINRLEQQARMIANLKKQKRRQKC